VDGLERGDDDRGQEPEGEEHVHATAHWATPSTFATKSAAERWLVKTEAEIQGDIWTDPDLGRALFGDYSQAWIAERANLRPNTVQVYRYVLSKHLLPSFGNRMVADIRGGARPALASRAAR
jgi:Phage integrase, N-terminal SAM-like domain